MTTREDLVQIFDACLNVLRDKEHITGVIALRTFSQLLVLKMIEPHFGKEIDIDNYDYNIRGKDAGAIRARLLQLARFSYLSEQDTTKLPRFMNKLWEFILSRHPKTKKIFLPGKQFDIESEKTYGVLTKKIGKINISDADIDIQGDAYEHVIKHILVGKTLGQYFTPPDVKRIMVDLVNPQVFEDGTCETVFDPAMGTGGFLISTLRHLRQQAAKKNIELDMNYISAIGLGGREPEPDTFQLALSNMLISSGYSFNMFQKGDSIRTPIKDKFDIVLSNPPFGLNSLKHAEVSGDTRLNYAPIKASGSVPLFLQAIVCMLKVGGRAAVVVPDGKEMFSTSKTIVNLRKYLMKTCDIHEIIALPAGVFTNTSIKTNIFFFTKIREPSDAVKLKVGYSNGIERQRSYKFVDDDATRSIIFSKFVDVTSGERRDVVEIPIEKIRDNDYMLIDQIYNLPTINLTRDNIILTLGELCKFASKSKRPASAGRGAGKYPFYTSSMSAIKFIDTADYDVESLIIGNGGAANVNFDNKFSVSNHCYVLQAQTKRILLKYVYYYIQQNLDILEARFTGMAIKNISKTAVRSVPIVVPSLEIQQEIVDKLNTVNENIKIAKQHIIDLRKSKSIIFDNYL